MLSGDLFQASVKVRPVYYVAGMFGIKEWSIEIWDLGLNKNSNDLGYFAMCVLSCLTPSMIARQPLQEEKVSQMLLLFLHTPFWELQRDYHICVLWFFLLFGLFRLQHPGDSNSLGLYTQKVPKVQAKVRAQGVTLMHGSHDKTCGSHFHPGVEIDAQPPPLCSSDGSRWWPVYTSS